MDEIDQFKAFSALIKKGDTIEEIASQFAISERLIKQRLAIAELISPIITAFRKDKINATTLRILTMATKKQQREWYDLFKTDENDAPQGHSLKRWLFGGADIDVADAIFDIDGYDGAIITDLFDEIKYFSDANLFWQHQSKAVAKLKENYIASGWSDVIILDIGEYFPSYEYVDTAKEDGGEIYISLSHSGEVTCFEGQLSRQEINAKNRSKDKTNNPAEKPELTKPLRNYLDLHRHSAVRTELLGHSGVAMRVAIAQIIVGSGLWTVHADPQKATKENIEASLSVNKAQKVFSKQRKVVAKLLGMDISDDDTLVPKKHDYGLSHDVGSIFSALLEMDDDSVNGLFSFVVAETLPSDSELVDIVGSHLQTDMAKYWKHDDAFFETIRDKKTVNAVLKEVAGSSFADANITSTAKVQKQKINNRLDADNTKNSAEWLPAYFKFPMEFYRDS